MKSILRKINGYIEGNKIHPISLGVFRIALGIALLFHFIVYLFPSVPLVYFNDGLLNQETYRSITYGIGYSIFDLPLPHGVVYLLFGLLLLGILLFIVGYRTRVVGAMLLFLLFNVFQRGAISGGAEKMFAMCLLTIAVFLPLNAACTFKSFRQHYTYNRRTFLLICSAIVIQCGWIYCGTGLLKIDIGWRNGTLLQEVISTDPLNSYAFFWGKGLGWTKIPCRLIPIVETIVGLSILFNSKHKIARIILGITLVSLHLSIISFLNLWHFCFYGLAISTLFFPFETWLQVEYNSINFSNGKSKWLPRLVVIYIALISWVNFKPIATKGVVRPLFKVTHLNKIIKKIEIPTLGLALPFSQNWGLVAKLPEQFGCIAFIGYDENGNTYNLVSQKEQTKVCCAYDNHAQKEMNEIIRIIYFYASPKEYKAVFNQLMISFTKYWEQAYPKIELISTDILFYSLDGRERIERKALD